MCSQILQSVLESQIHIHPRIGQQNWKTYGTNTDVSNNSNLAVREVQIIWPVLLGAHTVDIKIHVQRYLARPQIVFELSFCRLE